MAARFRCAIVWSPIPGLTWFLPFVGHMGVCDSEGNIFDFGGPVNKNNFMFGNPTRFIRCQPSDVSEWDTAVRSANCEFRKHSHDIVMDNCHHHVAHALNELRYGGVRAWSAVYLATWMFFCGRFTDVCGVLRFGIPIAVLGVIAVVAAVAIVGISSAM